MNITHNIEFKLDKYYLENNNVFRKNISKLGILREENKNFNEKFKTNTITKIFKLFKIKYYFDKSPTITNDLSFSILGTNYGLIIKPCDILFYTFIFEKYFKNKKELEKKINIDIFQKNIESKYKSNNKKFKKNINNLIVISSQTKHSIYDWKIINDLMCEPNNYLKLHPIMHPKVCENLVEKYGSDKIIESFYDLDTIIKQSENIVISGCTESMLTASLLKKNLKFLHKPNFTINGVDITYPILYYGLYNNFNITDILNTGCIGMIPWDKLDDIQFITEQIIFFKKEHDIWKHSNFNITCE